MVLIIFKSEWQIKSYIYIFWLDLSLQNALQHNRYQRRSVRSFKLNIVFPHTPSEKSDFYQNKQRELTPKNPFVNNRLQKLHQSVKMSIQNHKFTNKSNQAKPRRFWQKRILRNSYPENINVTVPTRYARRYPPSIGGDSRPNQTLNDKWQNNYVYGCRNHFLHFDITLPDKALIFMWILSCIHRGTPDKSHVQFSDGKKQL